LSEYFATDTVKIVFIFFGNLMISGLLLKHLLSLSGKNLWQFLLYLTAITIGLSAVGIILSFKILP